MGARVPGLTVGRFVPPIRADDRPIDRTARLPAAQTLALLGPMGRKWRWTRPQRARAGPGRGPGRCAAWFPLFNVFSFYQKHV